MKPSTLALATGLLSTAAVHADQPMRIVVDSDLSLEEATSGNHCEAGGDTRFAGVKARQALVDVLYWGLNSNGIPDQKVHQGQILVDQARVEDVRKIFEVAYRSRFPIHSVIPVSMFGWHDAASMNANNTSGWNFRGVGSKISCPPTSGASKHASMSPGVIAIDINTVQNPYMNADGVFEPSGAHWDPSKPGTLTKAHPIIKVATTAREQTVDLQLCPAEINTWECSSVTTQERGLGWTWGANWKAPDYQHLQYP